MKGRKEEMIMLAILRSCTGRIRCEYLHTHTCGMLPDQDTSEIVQVARRLSSLAPEGQLANPSLILICRGDLNRCGCWSGNMQDHVQYGAHELSERYLPIIHPR
jgi:hypothetical protein